MVRAGLAALTVAITVDRGEAHPKGRFAWGSGCLVGPNTVLTAAHVVSDAVAVSIRTADFNTYTAVIDPTFVGNPGAWDPDLPKAPDLALLTLPRSIEIIRLPVAVLDRGHPAGLIDRARTIGYPAFGETVSESKERVRLQVPAAGQVLLSDREDGLLDFQVTVQPSDRGAAGSPWHGMSGAPVVAGGCLIGVITEHASRKGGSNVAIIPLATLHPNPAHPTWGAEARQLDTWLARLGVSDTGTLAVMPPPREAPYVASLREFGRALHQRMPTLLNRQQELSEITAFATGADPYMWLVGGAFAGKSALLFETVAAGVLPDTVDVVSYFLSRRSSDATADRFLAAVVPQLEVLLDWHHESPSLDRFNKAWQEATYRTNRHLLLVIDALDEDLHVPGAPWVTDLLPAVVRSNSHVLVSSRPYPQIRDRVPSTHPLKTCVQLLIEPFIGAAELAELAKVEIDHLVTGDDLAVDVFGLLTAAAGPLSLTDLAALHAYPDAPTAVTRTNLRRLLTDRAARSLEPVGSYDTPRYRFAHDLLSEHARSNRDLADPEYRQRIRAWAEVWSDAGWPDPIPDGSGTPRYLLDTYPATLLPHADGAGRLPSNLIGWIQTAIRAVGIDAVVATLRAAQTQTQTETETETDEHLAALYAIVTAQQTNLRSPHPLDQAGYTLRHLAMQALRFRMSRLADELRHALRSQSTDFTPIWTTSRQGPPALELGSHEGIVLATVALPDGRICTGGSDGRVRIWDVHHPGAPLEVGAHDRGVAAIVALPDGRIATGGRDKRVLIWDLHHPGTPLELGVENSRVCALTALGDGRIATGGWDRRVLIWDPHHPGIPVELGTHDDWVFATTFMRDGRIASGGLDGRVLIWDLHHPGVPLELGTHHRGVSAITTLPDGGVATGGDDDGRVRIWDPDRPGTPLELGNHDRGVAAIAALPGGRIASGGYDGRIRIWDPQHPGTPVEIGDHDSKVGSITALRDGRIATGGYDGRVRVWNPHYTSAPVEYGSADRFITSVAALRDGRIATGGMDYRVLIWDPQNPGAPLELGSHDYVVEAVAALPDGRIATGGWDNRVLIWDPHFAGVPLELGAHDSLVTAIASLADGRIATGGHDARVLIWDHHHPGTPLEVGTHDDRVTAITSLADGRIATGGWDNRVLIWDHHHPGTPLEVGTHDDRVTAITSLADGRIVTGGEDGRVLIWDHHHPRTPLKIGTHDDWVNSVIALPDGRIATSGSDHKVRIWDARGHGTPVLELNERSASLAVSRVNTDYLIVAGSGIALWQITSP